ncbi:hypothetical protein BGLT_00776 [Caballeronia glathei]|jgi:hypothetical protein|nr:hypothetical protein B0G84_6849 [Paraburkholderia sp. BL8N3]CDY76907.1 hypothetical protein BGLT_00776 [Caballeronia glathei]
MTCILETLGALAVLASIVARISVLRRAGSGKRRR